MTQEHPSLKWLVTFRAVAHTGSVQKAAQNIGTSVSSVSHHLRCLEDHLSAALLDHGRRPMVLTPQGATYLRYAEQILALATDADRATKGPAAQHLQDLRFAMIEDFESDIGPEITKQLASALPRCRFKLYTRVSHEILSMMRDNALDIAIAAQPQTPLTNAEEFPILRDPFVIAAPHSTAQTAEGFLAGHSELPLLRYASGQMLGSAIEAHLNRLRISLDNTFELDSTASILSLVAQGRGWAITTPSNYARTKRCHAHVQLIPFPRREFARTLSLFTAGAHLHDIARVIVTSFQTQLSAQAIGPMTSAYPWLADSFRLLPDPFMAEERTDP